MNMKIIPQTLIALMLIALLFGSSGCMTYNTVQCAKGHPENAMWFSFGGEESNSKPDDKPHPAYYALLPLTVPLDIATSPIQLLTFGVLLAFGSGFNPH